MCRPIFFNVEWAPAETHDASGAQTPCGVGPNRKKNPVESLIPCVTGEGLSWGLKAYRENECVFKVKNKDILEK